MCVFFHPTGRGRFAPRRDRWEGTKRVFQVNEWMEINLSRRGWLGTTKRGALWTERGGPGEVFLFSMALLFGVSFCLSKPPSTKPIVCVPVKKCCWYFRNPKANHRFECINPVINNGISITILNLLAGFLVAINSMALFVWKNAHIVHLGS